MPCNTVAWATTTKVVSALMTVPFRCSVAARSCSDTVGFSSADEVMYQWGGKRLLGMLYFATMQRTVRLFCIAVGGFTPDCHHRHHFHHHKGLQVGRMSHAQQRPSQHPCSCGVRNRRWCPGCQLSPVQNAVSHCGCCFERQAEHAAKDCGCGVGS